VEEAASHSSGEQVVSWALDDTAAADGVDTVGVHR